MCAQEAWAMKNDSVSEFVGSGENDILFCGLALGYKDEDAVINQIHQREGRLSNGLNFSD